MALFQTPPAKKPDAPPRTPVSARDVAAQADARRGAAARPRAEPVADFSMTGASLIEWSPVRTSAIEVGQVSPGMCTVLENAALLYASGQTQPARALLEQGIVSDHDAKNSPLAWLALFDLHQRVSDRAAFDQLALTYVVQFERSPPPWEGDDKPAAVSPPKLSGGGYTLITGKLTAATAPQIEAFRKNIAKAAGPMRLDLAQVAGFDDAGARLLSDALAEARKRRVSLALQKPDKMRAALDILVRRGREAGEGTWLLSLELLQFDGKQDAFEERAIEYAVAFEQSPPSWEPPPPAAGVASSPAEEAAADETSGSADAVEWTGVMSGPSPSAMAAIAEHAHAHPVIVIDMTGVARVDFVCAGALLNTINRVESQRKAVQIAGASPIIRALLLLIGISPRHFLKKAQ
ncbi:MAG: STAS domain-containing protein [Burkholderiales bacterium]|nr:STAS domain-containing protein [Burkholderiales bacterium]